ncbi:HGGxSTG domain-containing protein [Ruegeria sp. HKCCD7255]|uniref:HGGxSTG domain-containing protein n=1 Tax=Ruegeria sp. HKCCD7255 TaxID=2683004 RepID=UPI002739C344|nr:HGGxSTG domain-containing protein [Ruegeria sp. HKCCD7255]
MRSHIQIDPLNWLTIRSRWGPCPAEAHKHRDYRRDCSHCSGVIGKRLVELDLNDNGEPLPKSERSACGAKTRAGGQCQARVVPGKRRCRLHGGLSTGPKEKAKQAPHRVRMRI